MFDYNIFYLNNFKNLIFSIYDKFCSFFGFFFFTTVEEAIVMIDDYLSTTILGDTVIDIIHNILSFLTYGYHDQILIFFIIGAFTFFTLFAHLVKLMLSFLPT